MNKMKVLGAAIAIVLAVSTVLWSTRPTDGGVVPHVGIDHRGDSVHQASRSPHSAQARAEGPSRRDSRQPWGRSPSWSQPMIADDEEPQSFDDLVVCPPEAGGACMVPEATPAVAFDSPMSAVLVPDSAAAGSADVARHAAEYVNELESNQGVDPMEMLEDRVKRTAPLGEARDAMVDAGAAFLRGTPDKLRAFVQRATELGWATPTGYALLVESGEPKDVLEWLDTSGVDLTVAARAAVESFQRWIAQDPHSAADWLQNHPDFPSRSVLISELAYRLSADEPDPATDWLWSELDHDVYEAVRGVLEQPSDGEPADPA